MAAEVYVCSCMCECLPCLGGTVPMRALVERTQIKMVEFKIERMKE